MELINHVPIMELILGTHVKKPRKEGIINQYNKRVKKGDCLRISYPTTYDADMSESVAGE